MTARVLIVDGDDAYCVSAARALDAAGVEVVFVAGDEGAALQLAADESPTVIVVDVPTFGGEAAAVAQRLQRTSGPGTAVLAVAPEAHADRVAEMVAAGARGYVVKESLDELVLAVDAIGHGTSLLSEEVTRPVLDEIARLYDRERVRNQELEELVRQLQALSVTDWLTGLKNHGYFFERLGEELDRALRHRRPLALVVADLDDFKRVNDSKGHAAGDRVLQEAGRILREEVRSADVVCRIGGEEFGILLPETDAPGAYLVAERIRETIGRNSVPGVGRVTVSMGIASAPEHAIDRDELVESADRALYIAKREGKDRSRVAGQVVALSAPPVARPLRGEIVELLVRILRLRDPHLADHALRTAEIGIALGAGLSLTAAELEHLRVASLLQDVGKIGVPDAVLYKRGPLSESEWQLIREHPRRGFDILGNLVHPDVAEAVLANHERFDGAGYPRGLAGDEIPYLARILLVADAFAAMTSIRPFKEPLDAREALDELRRHAGTQFDPRVVEAMGDLAVDIELGAARAVADAARG